MRRHRRETRQVRSTPSTLNVKKINTARGQGELGESVKVVKKGLTEKETFRTHLKEVREEIMWLPAG